MYKSAFAIASLLALIGVACLGVAGPTIAAGPCNPTVQTCL